MYNAYLPRKEIAISLFLFTFFISMIFLIAGQIDDNLIIDFLKNDNVKLFLGEVVPDYQLPSLFGGSGIISFIFSDFKNVIFGMIVPFGFLISILSFMLNTFSLGDYLSKFQISIIILNIYYMYICALSIDTGFYMTLYTIKRQKEMLKEEIGLFFDRFMFLMMLIIVFNVLWWCFG
jgi:hypothetical protein